MSKQTGKTDRHGGGFLQPAYHACRAIPQRTPCWAQDWDITCCQTWAFETVDDPTGPQFCPSSPARPACPQTPHVPFPTLPLPQTFPHTFTPAHPVAPCLPHPLPPAVALPPPYPHPYHYADRQAGGVVGGLWHCFEGLNPD